MAKISRAETTRLNDEAILDAVCTLILKQGWDEISISGVAKEAGVSVGAIYARAENLSELANNLWEARLRGVVEEVLDRISEAIVSADIEKMLKVSSYMDQQRNLLTPTLELLVASQFDEELAEVISEDFTRLISLRTVPLTESLADRHLSATHFLVMSFLFGRTMAMRRGNELEPLSYAEADILAAFSQMKPEEVNIPVASTEFLKQSESENSSWGLSVLQVISKWGYRRATVSRMSRSTGQTPGALISGYTSKADLVGQVAREFLYSPMEMWEPFVTRIPQEGSAEIRASFLKVYLAPDNRGLWKLNLELARVAETYPELAQFKTPSDALQRTHLAVMFLALFTYGASELPFLGAFRAGATT